MKSSSHLIHDEERPHPVLIERFNLVHEAYDSNKLKKLPDEENPLDPINEIHSLAKRFMRAHGGYNRENLQDWMNLIAFLLSAPRDRYVKIDLFINMALNSTRVVKYRDVMSKKSSK